MPAALVTVFGGSGFLGREIVRGLVEKQMRVRVAVRHPERLQFGDTHELVSAVEADVRDEATVVTAVEGAHAVVNAIGLYVERGSESFDAVHVRGAAHVARQAAASGVERLVHVSGIGATTISPSRYVRARAIGELRVRESFDSATIVRPSVLFGAGDAFLNGVDAISRFAPLFPLFGRGRARLQPVYVGDVADAVTRIIDKPAMAETPYELGGPRIYAYRDLINLVLNYRRRKRLLVPVPFAIWTILAKLLSALPNPPLTSDQVILMRGDNVVGGRVLTFEDLGVTAHSVEEMLPLCLGANSGAVA